MTAATVRPAEEWNSADAWAALHHAETSPHDLASIARAFPHYAEQIAGHPRAYPALVEWAGVVAAGRRTTPDTRESMAAGTTDVVAAGRRESGAHPLAFSGDAAAWRAAVAAGAALTQGAQRTAGSQADRTSERVPWTPADPTAPVAPVAPVAAAVDPAGSPWWADVTPRAAPALPASAAPAAPAAPASSAVGDPAPAADAAPTRAPAPEHAPAAASAPAGDAQPPAPVNGKALLGFVFAFVLAPLGIVFAHLALREIARTGEAGRGYARAGLVIGYTLVALGALAGGASLWVGLSG